MLPSFEDEITVEDKARHPVNTITISAFSRKLFKNCLIESVEYNWYNDHTAHTLHTIPFMEL